MYPGFCIFVFLLKLTPKKVYCNYELFIFIKKNSLQVTGKCFDLNQKMHFITYLKRNEKRERERESSGSIPFAQKMKQLTTRLAVPDVPFGFRFERGVMDIEFSWWCLIKSQLGRWYFLCASGRIKRNKSRSCSRCEREKTKRKCLERRSFCLLHILNWICSVLKLSATMAGLLILVFVRCKPSRIQDSDANCCHQFLLLSRGETAIVAYYNVLSLDVMR